MSGVRVHELTINEKFVNLCTLTHALTPRKIAIGPRNGVFSPFCGFLWLRKFRCAGPASPRLPRAARFTIHRSLAEACFPHTSPASPSHTHHHATRSPTPFRCRTTPPPRHLPQDRHWRHREKPQLPTRRTPHPDLRLPR